MSIEHEMKNYCSRTAETDYQPYEVLTSNAALNAQASAPSNGPNRNPKIKNEHQNQEHIWSDSADS